MVVSRDTFAQLPIRLVFFGARANSNGPPSPPTHHHRRPPPETTLLNKLVPLFLTRGVVLIYFPIWYLFGNSSACDQFRLPKQRFRASQFPNLKIRPGNLQWRRGGSFHTGRLRLTAPDGLLVVLPRMGPAVVQARARRTCRFYTYDCMVCAQFAKSEKGPLVINMKR